MTISVFHLGQLIHVSPQHKKSEQGKPDDRGDSWGRMPRKVRIDAPGALHHIIFRGIERRKIFQDNKDRDNFLDRLGNVLSDSGTPCYAWALIPNHVHLLLKTGDTPLFVVHLQFEFTLFVAQIMASDLYFL